MLMTTAERAVGKLQIPLGPAPRFLIPQIPGGEEGAGAIRSFFHFYLW